MTTTTTRVGPYYKKGGKRWHTFWEIFEERCQKVGWQVRKLLRKSVPKEGGWQQQQLEGPFLQKRLKI
jgi:hypothetical protein